MYIGMEILISLFIMNTSEFTGIMCIFHHIVELYEEKIFHFFFESLIDLRTLEDS